jgi:hypothetical protein
MLPCSHTVTYSNTQTLSLCNTPAYTHMNKHVFEDMNAHACSHNTHTHMGDVFHEHGSFTVRPRIGAMPYNPVGKVCKALGGQGRLGHEE